MLPNEPINERKRQFFYYYHYYSFFCLNRGKQMEKKLINIPPSTYLNTKYVEVKKGK